MNYKFHSLFIFVVVLLSIGHKIIWLFIIGIINIPTDKWDCIYRFITDKDKLTVYWSWFLADPKRIASEFVICLDAIEASDPDQEHNDQEEGHEEAGEHGRGHVCKQLTVCVDCLQQPGFGSSVSEVDNCLGLIGKNLYEFFGGDLLKFLQDRADHLVEFLDWNEEGVGLGFGDVGWLEHFLNSLDQVASLKATVHNEALYLLILGHVLCQCGWVKNVFFAVW